MTAINLKVTFPEEGSGAIGFSFTGLDSEALIPNTFLWTLTDTSGNVINSRQDVVESPLSTTWVLLYGDDLAMNIPSKVRVLTIKGTYNTTLDGVSKTNLPYTGEYRFNVGDFLNIT